MFLQKSITFDENLKKILGQQLNIIFRWGQHQALLLKQKQPSMGL